MSTIRKVLIEARGLIEKGWTQGTFARDAEGVEVVSIDHSAVCFCAIGAIKRATLWGEHEVRNLALAALEKEIGEEWIISSWNDAPERTKEEVLSAFDRAIESAV